MINQYVDYMAADSDAWQTSFDLIMQVYQEDPTYRTAVTELYQKMLDWNESHMGEIVLPEQTMTWLTQLGIAAG